MTQGLRPPGVQSDLAPHDLVDVFANKLGCAVWNDLNADLRRSTSTQMLGLRSRVV
jgi:hypothetical protein